MAGNDPMEAALQLIATLSAGLFAGAATYVTFVEHPPRGCTAALALAVTAFGPSYKRATMMQAPLAAVGFLSGTAAWLIGAHVLRAAGGVLLGEQSSRFTLIVIAPTNRQLLDPALDRDSPLAEAASPPLGSGCIALRTISSGAFAFVTFSDPEAPLSHYPQVRPTRPLVQSTPPASGPTSWRLRRSGRRPNWLNSEEGLSYSRHVLLRSSS